MKNPLLYLKEKEHQHAFYAVAIFIMLSILFFFLVSLKSPETDEVAKEMPTETLVEISFDELATASGSEFANTPKTSTAVAPEVAVQNDPVVKVDKSSVDPVDESFNFNPSKGAEKGLDFGDDDGPVIASSGKDEGHKTKRSILKNPNFSADSQEEGEIALKLWVDEAGFVVKAILDPKQSNSGSKFLIDEAIKAAKTMQYDSSPGVHVEYVGTKIFSFIKA